MKLFATDKDIDGAIARVKKDGKAFQSLVHRTAFSILQLGMKNKDFTKGAKQMTALIAAMPGAARSNALIKWAESFMPLRWNTDEKAFQYSNMKGFTVDLVEAKRTPFWDFVPEEDYKPITDWNKIVKGLVTRADKDLKEMGDKSKVNAEQLELIRQFVA